MRICLLRHGITDWNNLGKLQGRENVPLNSIGIEQVKDAAKYLKNHKWKAIITSPLSRARMSAEIIAKEIGNIEIHEEIDFIERDYGKASGMDLEERTKNFPDGKWSGEEPMEKLQNRTVNALLRYIKEYDGNDFIIVSHGLAINAILANLFKIEISADKSVLRNACIAVLEKKEDGIILLLCDKTASELTEN